MQRLSILLLILLWACSDTQGTYHGSVVDADTGKPLEGASVTVVWRRRPFVAMNGPNYFHNAKETLTDKDGRFSVDASPGIDWSPFTYLLREPDIVIFKPGYGPFPVAQVTPRFILESGNKRLLEFAELNALLLKGTTVKLRRLKTREELRKFRSPSDVWLIVPFERIPILMRLINQQREILGLQPYPGF